MAKINLLDGVLARKIAAGEVIDRPYSLVRELMDNSIDAQSTEINVYVEGGGISRLRVVDNGEGMDAEDLKRCWLPHATSKIATEEDLFNIRSLGFRGEALSSIAACSRLHILSSRGDEGEAYELRIHGGQDLGVHSARGRKGSIVDVSELFYSLPARRKFLKRPGTESSLCKKHFIEKAIPFPDIAFKYFNEGKMKLFLPPSSLKERVLNCYPGKFNSTFFHYITRVEDKFSIQLVAALPECHRNDRRYIQIFANNRRLDEFAFIQAIQYGYDEYLPGGLFPVCFLFLDIDPDLIDFNVHPAKREARIRNLPEIHHAVVSVIKDFLKLNKGNAKERPIVSVEKSLFSETVSVPDKEYSQHSHSISEASIYKRRENYTPNPPGRAAFSQETVQRQVPEYISQADSSGKRDTATGASPRYIGQIMDCYLLAEWKDALYVVDQHAAHERIIYDQLVQQKPEVQEMLIPSPIILETDEEPLLKSRMEMLRSLGFQIERGESEGEWLVTSMPVAARQLKGDLKGIFLMETGSLSEIRRELYARIACKAAVKEGEDLDSLTASELVNKAFSLEFPRCPHGRPLWFSVTHGELDQIVGRSV